MTEARRMCPIVPVILAGGTGTRLWPLSRTRHPKQFLPLMGEDTLLVATCRRFADPAYFSSPVVICNSQHRFLVAEQLREAGIEPQAIILEPVARGTAAAAAVAALFVARSNPAGILLLLAADSHLRRDTAFLASVAIGQSAASAGRIVVFGVTPTRPETGFGYIKTGKATGNGSGVLLVDAFVEKPDRAGAEMMSGSGGYLWNSGNFLFRADTMLQEFARLEPAILEASSQTLCRSRMSDDFVLLDEAALAAAPPNSLDRAIMEQTDRAAVVPTEAEWSDIGTWDALWAASAKDENGNYLFGDVFVEDVNHSYIRGSRRLIAAVGVGNLVVVETDDAVFIASRDRAAETKRLVERLQLLGRLETIDHPCVRKSWGSSRQVDRGNHFSINLLIVIPGARISRQAHRSRTEHWVVAEGTAGVTFGEETHLLQAGKSICMPAGAAYRLENSDTEPLCLIKVLIGPIPDGGENTAELD